MINPLFCWARVFSSITVSVIAVSFGVAYAGSMNVATYATYGTFADINPVSGFSDESIMNQNLYETLTFYNPPGSAETLSPKLATSWSSNSDSTEWTFNLRSGVTFHDGTPFNADAVKYSINLVKESGLGAAFIHDPITGIEVVDDLTVKFTLSYPAPLDVILSSGYGAYMLSPGAADEDLDWYRAGNDAGTGPYMIESYDPSARLIVDQYPAYWGGWEDGQFTKVVFEIIEDPTVREQLIRSGEIEFTYGLPWENYETLSSVEGVDVVRTPSFQNLLGLLNTRRPPLDNASVRRALALSFPYKVVAENLYAGYGTQATGAVPTGIWGSIPEASMSQDLEEAERLLAEAGIGRDELNVVWTYVAGDLNEQQVGEIWRAELSRIGVNLEVKGMTWDAQWDQAMTNPEAAQDIFAFYWWPTYVTPYDFLVSMFHSEDEPFFGLSYYNNPAFDAMIDEAASLSGTDQQTAAGMFQQAGQMLVDDAVAVFMLDLPDIHVIRSDVSGYVNNPGYPHVVYWYNLRR